jgi:hypothetical protein
MIAVIKPLKQTDLNYLLEDRVYNILVRIEKDHWSGRVGDVGIIIKRGSREKNNLRWSIRFANGNEGIEYPDLVFGILSEVSAGRYSFYLIEIN